MSDLERVAVQGDNEQPWNLVSAAEGNQDLL